MISIVVLWAFIGYGMTTILVYGSIFDKPRAWIKRNSKFFGDLIGCMMCTSTWVGFFLSIFFYSPAQELMNFTPYWSWFFDGCLASGAVWAVNALVEHWEHR